ncbi:hypothetical protein [uncultured Xylophilus sp.]|uniref:YrzE family protein n=1 Tax=uncultured Xylophilus sp. TaxID=296832 RepID=UPI0026002833|nr:hypothetical protein [uncultured Xylophilus sp.]
MPIVSPAAPLDPRPWHSAISWGAVFAGFVLSLVVYLILSVLGTAIGASAIDPMGDRNPFAGFGVATGVWAGVTTLIAIAVGGYFAGHLARAEGGLHGLLAWALTTLVTVYLVISATGSALGAVGSTARAGLSAAGSVAGAGLSAAAPSVGGAVKGQLEQAGISLDINSLQSELEKLLRQTGKPELQPENLKGEAQAAAQDGQARASDAATTPQNADTDAKGWLANVIQRGEKVLNAADKEALVNIIVARTGKSRAEAEQIANNYEQTYNQARAKFDQAKEQAEQKAREAGAEAAKSVAKGSWGTLVVLLIGAAIAAFAGTLGLRRQRRDVYVAA